MGLLKISSEIKDEECRAGCLAHRESQVDVSCDWTMVLNSHAGWCLFVGQPWISWRLRCTLAQGSDQRELSRSLPELHLISFLHM